MRTASSRTIYKHLVHGCFEKIDQHRIRYLFTIAAWPCRDKYRLANQQEASQYLAVHANIWQKVWDNRGLAYHILFKMKVPQYKHEILVHNVGISTLLKCVQKFDVSLGFKFSTYATNALKNAFISELIKCNDYSKRFTSVADIPRIDRINIDTQEIKPVEYLIECNDILGDLSQQDHELITLKFWQGLTNQEIADKRNTNRHQVARDLAEILEWLKERCC